jgi:hypothetical protein
MSIIPTDALGNVLMVVTGADPRCGMYISVTNLYCAILIDGLVTTIGKLLVVAFTLSGDDTIDNAIL